METDVGESSNGGQGTTPAVELSVAIAASAETVWGILSDPTGFSAWMEGEVTFEPKAGSPFRAAFPNYHTVISGEIVALDGDQRRLAVTWGIETGMQAEEYPAGSTLVEFHVRPDGAGCRVDLRQTGLSSARMAQQQDGGWRFQLSRLDLRANRTDLAAGLERTLPEWVAAWNEHDDEARIATLRRCCAEDVTLRDDWTAMSGIGLLSMHIGNCHQYMPGYSLEHTADVRICRGEALVGWRATGPGGIPMEGFNHVQADPDGTIRRVVGFASG